MSTSTSLPPNLRALLVGGTSGISKAIAVRLASSLPASRITIAGRSAASASEIIASATNNNIDFEKVDASSMADVKRMCKEFSAKLEAEKAAGKSSGQIDLLVLSQGILTMAGRTPTPDGIDMKMALHYYSRMLFVRELESSLAASGIVLSILDGYRSDPYSSSVNWEDLDLAKAGSYSLSKCAAQCLALTDIQLATFASKKGNEFRTFIHAYPGTVNTPLLTKSLPGWAGTILKPVTKLITVTPEVCAAAMLDGVHNARVAQAETGKNLYNTDNHGKLLVKKEIDAEKLKKVEEHTWALVDGKKTEV